MKQKLRLFLSMLLSLSVLFATSCIEVKAESTITSNQTGTNGGYDYELWKDNGTTSMTLKDGGAFQCSWSNINNALFRKGKKFDETKTHGEIGNISVDYACDYQPSGNSYLCVYGWTIDPLVEYYIIDSWGTWRPPGSTSKGTITVDGGTYDVYETTRTNQPSIQGNTTFQQYWSVRTSKKTSGTISVSEHFKAWESKGMKLGKMYEVALTVEGYQSSGKADVRSMSINIGDKNTNTKEPVQKDINPNTENVVKDNIKKETSKSTASAFEKIEAEKYDKTNSSSIKVSGTKKNGKAISYIERGNTVTYKDVDFGQGVSSMSATIATKEKTKIEVREGTEKGTLLGTLSTKSTGGWNKYKKKSTTIKNTTGVKDVVLVFSGPVNMDSFKFKADTTDDTNEKSKGDSGNWWSNWNWFAKWFAKPDSNSKENTDSEKTVNKTVNKEDEKTTDVTAKETKDKFHVFLLIGQSNMAGYPKAQASDKVEDPRIQVLGYEDNQTLGRVKDQWDVASAPLHETYQDAIGPGDWFAKTLIEKLPEGDTIGLVPCAISGEKIETFLKSGGSKYDWIVERAKLAQEKGGIIDGIIFHQGESNNGDSNWPEKVKTLVEDLRKDLNLGDVPFIAGELPYSGGCSGHNTLVNKLPSVIKNCSVVSADGLTLDPADTQWKLHFSHDSQVDLGKRYAGKMAEALGWK